MPDRVEAFVQVSTAALATVEAAVVKHAEEAVQCAMPGVQLSYMHGNQHSATCVQITPWTRAGGAEAGECDCRRGPHLDHGLRLLLPERRCVLCGRGISCCVQRDM